jgi:hypothetical protein
MSRSGAASAVWCCSTCGAVYHKDYPRCPNDGGEVIVSPIDPMLGKTIGRYVIDRFIGEGGMGRVYEAHHATLANKRYAVKVLLGDAGATPSMRKRFAREAESASRLVHPNVVGVIDYGATEGGLPYIVMDFVDGQSLAELIDSGPMPPARVIRLVRAVCDGLAFAHAAGVVHRDLKPATSSSPPMTCRESPTSGSRRRSTPAMRASPAPAWRWARRPMPRPSRWPARSSTTAPISTRSA